MTYARITIHCRDGSTRSGVRAFEGLLSADELKTYVWQLSAEVLGRNAIDDISVEELPASDPAVVALILKSQQKAPEIPRSDGTHPFVKEQGLKSRH